ncbi:MAG: tetratricopeptide repeat-containing sensor histidine kinase, partial [Bacteroidota bacterium]
GLKSLGFCFGRVAKNNEALPLLQEALALFESFNDPEGQAVVNEYLAVIHRNRGDFGAALELLFKSLEVNEQTALNENTGTNHYHIGVTYKYLGNFEKALDSLYKSLSIYRELNNRLFESYPINVIGTIYFENGDYTKALENYQEGLMLRQESQDKLGEAGSLDNIGLTYSKLNDYSQAIDYCTRSLTISESTDDQRSQANAMQHIAEIYKQAGDAGQAIKFCNQSLDIRKQIGDKRGETEILLFLASLHKDQPGNSQKVFTWLSNALHITQEIKGLDLLSKTRFALYDYFKQEEKFKEAIEQLELHIDLEKELHKNAISQKVQNLEISRKAEETLKEAEAMGQRNKELIELNGKIEMQKQELEATLAELKATQAQLIQSEKMASLGELTAGIAHEIQNPLNFVNNFSEVSNELISEMAEELDKGNAAGAREIAKDVQQNLEKILHHGKRADSIVKGMLQHSRSSSGQKEFTDINALADEYLRLAYHGLRAKDKTFNAATKTDYDENAGLIRIIPQDIGRVILNLITNAFYAVAERRNLPPFPSTGGVEGTTPYDYEPVVTVTTKRHGPPSGYGSKIEICIKDNGNGIPQKVLDKIFQPFFTTKPTGQGTGLGLSLSYDIVQAHGGGLRVETKEGEGSEFIISLPVN